MLQNDNVPVFNLLDISSHLSSLKSIPTLPVRRKYVQKLAKQIVKQSPEALIELINQAYNKAKHYENKIDLSSITHGKANMPNVPQEYTLLWELIAGLLTPELYAYNSKFVFSYIKKLAEHPLWTIREEAATVLKALKTKYPQNILEVLEEWSKQSNTYLKRAICVAIIKPFKNEQNYLPKIYGILERIIKCNDNYVKKNCGPFGLAYLYKRYPEQTHKVLKNWIQKYRTNCVVLWNIVMVFSQANAKRFPEQGQEIVRQVKKVADFNTCPKLKRAVESVERKVG